MFLFDDIAGVAAEHVGREAAQMLLNNLDHGGCVDEYLQDQVFKNQLIYSHNHNNFTHRFHNVTISCLKIASGSRVWVMQSSTNQEEQVMSLIFKKLL